MSSRGDVALAAALLGAILLAAALLCIGPTPSPEMPPSRRSPSPAHSMGLATLEASARTPPSSASESSAERAPESAKPTVAEFTGAAEASPSLTGVDRVILAAHRRASFADRLRGVMALDEADRDRGLRELAEAINDEGGSADRECLQFLESGADPALLEAMTRFFDVAGDKGKFDKALVGRAIEFMKQAGTPAERRAAAMLALQYRGAGVLTKNDDALAEVLQRDGDPLLLRKIAWHYRQVTDAEPPPALARVVAHLAEGDLRSETRTAALAARFWVGAGPDRGLARLQEVLAIGDTHARQELVKAIAESELPSLGGSQGNFDPEVEIQGSQNGRGAARAPAGLSEMVVRIYQEGADARVRSLFLRSMVSNMGVGGGKQAEQAEFLQRLAAVEQDEAWRDRLQSVLSSARVQRLNQEQLLEALYGDAR